MSVNSMARVTWGVAKFPMQTCTVQNQYLRLNPCSLISLNALIHARPQQRSNVASYWIHFECFILGFPTSVISANKE
eukprot:8715569-Pyramimonas_sp.AAC.1